jgi:RES domain
MAVPDPPKSLRPRLITWPPERAFNRIHPLRHHATQFHSASKATVNGRFHFFEDADGVVVPVLYGAETIDAAIAEVVFRKVPVRATPRFLPIESLDGLALSVITPARPLALIELLGHGLRRLGLEAEELTSTGAPEYPRTVTWAQRLHEAAPAADGMVWMSRQFNASQALMLFGDRIKQHELSAGEPLNLSSGRGFTLIESAASAAAIILT